MKTAIAIVFRGMVIFSVFLLAALLPTLALAASPGLDYRFPYKDPYISTLTVGLMKERATRVQSRQLLFQSFSLKAEFPGRGTVPYANGRDSFDVRYALAGRRAPLVIIQAGLGGSTYSSTSAFLADHFQEMGYSVATVGSPLTWNFALAACTSGLPGVSSRDAQDLYRIYQRSIAELRARAGIEPRSVAYVGFSLGAFEGLRVAELDRNSDAPIFKRFLLINPPNDLAYGLGVIDSGVATSYQKLGGSHVAQLTNRLTTTGLALRSRPIESDDYFLNLTDKFPLSNDDARFLVLSSLRSEQADLVLMTQSIYDQGVLPGPATSSNLSLRESIASRVSFTEYVYKIVGRAFAAQLGLSRDSDEFKARLKSELTFITDSDGATADERVFVMQNADDIFIRPTDLEFQQQVFGERMTTYPAGGHLGNMWYPKNLADMSAVLQGL